MPEELHGNNDSIILLLSPAGSGSSVSRLSSSFVSANRATAEERVSGTLTGAPGVPHRVFQPELRNRLADPSLRPIRLASFYRMSDLFNFFLGLRAVKPLQIFLRLGDRPRAEEPLLLLLSVQAGVQRSTTANPPPF